MGLFHIIGFSCLVRLWRSEFSSLLWLFNFGELSQWQDSADICCTVSPTSAYCLLSIMPFESHYLDRNLQTKWILKHLYWSLYLIKKMCMEFCITLNIMEIVFHEYDLCGLWKLSHDLFFYVNTYCLKFPNKQITRICRDIACLFELVHQSEAYFKGVL